LIFKISLGGGSHQSSFCRHVLSSIICIILICYLWNCSAVTISSFLLWPKMVYPTVILMKCIRNE
jgi:hypothetical protein